MPVAVETGGGDRWLALVEAAADCVCSPREASAPQKDPATSGCAFSDAYLLVASAGRLAAVGVGETRLLLEDRSRICYCANAGKVVWDEA